MKTGSYIEFKSHLDAFAMRIDGKNASTATRLDEADLQASVRSYWEQNSGTSPKWHNTRTVAYLAAYVDWAGSSFRAGGFNLNDGFLRPDRAVMRSLLQGEFVELEAGEFRLTAKGAALIAPFVVVEGLH
jgi:hypothetical protein